MLTLWKVVGITTAAILVVGSVAGSLTWGILANRGRSRSRPELVHLDWWEHTVIYQIYPRSFMDSDGDGIGDLKGIASRLDHLVDIGVGAIWLSPIFVSPMVDFGYDISDFYNIQPEYGTMADFEELVQKAHDLGIKILLDYVPNHASNESEYFKRSLAREPGYENFFVWADPKIDPNNSNRLPPSNWISEFGGSVWEWSEIRQQYYLHQFAKEQVDFNYRDPAVKAEMLNIMKYWFEKGADGYRVDAVAHLFEADPNEHGGVYPDEPLSGNMFLSPNQSGYTTQEYTRHLIELYDVVYEWREFADNWKEENKSDTKILLTEAYANVTMTMLYYGDERSKVGAHFPFNFDMITSLSGDSNARDFVYIIKHWLTYMPSGRVANWVFGNHDQQRMPSRFRLNMVDGLNSLNMLLPGVAITYQGEEIGMRDGYVSWEDTVDVAACNQGNPDNYLEFSRDPARTPYQWDNTTSAGFSTSANTWLPVGLDYMEINLRSQQEAERSHYKVYKSMVRLRKQPALSHGSYHIEPLTRNTFILIRHLITYDTYALLFNVGDEEDTVDLSTVTFLTDPLTVYVSSVHSSRVAGVELLGINISSNLNFGQCIESKAKTAGKKLGILNKVKRYFTPEQLLILYQAQVRSCMEYCSHLWDGSAKYQLDALDSVDRRARRLIGTIKQLGYVRALGADAVILSPIFARSTDWTAPGVVDFTDIDARYGTFNHFSGLVEKAKKLELKLLITLPLQTIKSSSELFNLSAERRPGYEDQLVWRDGKEEEPRTAEEGVDKWRWHEIRAAYFGSTINNEALLNLCSDAVVAMFSDVQCSWLKRGLAGVVLTPDFVLDVNCGVQLVRKMTVAAMGCARNANMDAPIILVETSLGAELGAKYYGEGSAGANSVISYALAATQKRSAPNLALDLHASMLFPPQDTAPTWTTSITNQSRIATRYGNEMVDAILLLALTLPGAVLIQQGDELGAADTILEWADTTKCWPTPAHASAAPFPWDDTPTASFTSGKPWLPLATNYRYANAKTEYANDLSHVGVMRVAAAMRRSPAMGPHVEINRFGDALAVLRWGGSGSLLVVTNLGSGQIEIVLSKIPGLPQEMTAAVSSGGSSLSTGSHVNLDKALKLAAGETVLLAGPSRHCGGPGPVDKITSKLSEGWQKLNKYFGNF